MYFMMNMSSDNWTKMTFNDTGDWFNTYDFDAGSPFKYLSLQVFFGILYSVVFLGCIGGNALVVFVIVRHPQMCNITNFLLANLALADFLVGVFCVIPNLMSFFSPYWYAGQVMCKLYFFIQCVCYTASIIFLTIISVERYVVIVHPMKSRILRRKCLMRTVIIATWASAMVYGIPILIAYDTVTLEENDMVVAFCTNVSDMNINSMLILNFVLWYCFPLLLMVSLYGKIAMVLRHSSKMHGTTVTTRSYSQVSLQSNCKTSCEILHSTSKCTSTPCLNNIIALQTPNGKESKLSVVTKVQKHSRSMVDLLGGNGGEDFSGNRLRPCSSNCSQLTALTHSSMMSISPPKQKRGRHALVPNAMRSRQRVIRLLVILILCFAVCMLPHHVRLMWQLGVRHDQHPSFGNRLVPPITFFIFYLNSALNPLVYAFLSESYRRRLGELLGRKKQLSRRRRANGYHLKNGGANGVRQTVL